MRIYDLAKELGKRFNTTVKAADLANEIRDNPEFKEFKDVIKSHSSSVDEEVVDRVFELYEERHEGAAAAVDAEALARKRAEDEKRAEEIRQRRSLLDQQKQQEISAKQAEIEKARQQREEEFRRRQSTTPKSAGGMLAQPRPMMPPPGGPARATGMGSPIPLPQRRLIGQPSTSSAPPPISSASAPASVVTAQSAPPAPPTPKTAFQPRPVRPEKPMIRPTGTAQELRSSSGSSGYSSGPIGRQGGPGGPAVARPGLRPDGQPLPPPPPVLRSDSPLVRRPPRPPQMDRPPYRPGGPGGSGGDDSRRGGPPRGPVGRSDDRGPRRPDDRGPRRPGDRPGGPGDRPSRDGRGAPGGPLVLPDIEVMGFKGGVRRKPGAIGDKAKGPVEVKKKKLKTIVREEIEVKPSKIYGLADEFRRPVLKKKSQEPAARQGRRSNIVEAPRRPEGPVRIGSTLTLGEFAERIQVSVPDIIRQLVLMGKPVTINQLIDPDLCELIAQEHGIELEVQTEGDEQDIEAYRPAEETTNLAPRSPVVTIMGHVDHGKTTLLDAYRSSTVAAGEFGGITQHIGAYQVQTSRGKVTFLDTPGHEAFTAMRARGAQVTDIVVLVVSADDGVMPQTVEAISHAREAGVPIIIAINKIDLPQADPGRVRNELMQHNILPEELGGSNIFVNISAKKRLHLDELLEMILLQADVLELKADPTCHAEGTIIESHTDPLRGAVATVLVEKGTLHVGDIFVVGTQSGRVRLMLDDHGKEIKEAGPSYPVEIIGLTGTPGVGELFIQMSEERIAREIASRRTDRRRLKELGMTRHVTLEGLHELVEEGKLKDLKIILKADVQGSLEAICQSLVKLSNEEVKVRILHRSTGGITESDVNLASASDAVIIGFNVRPDPNAAALAQHEGIDLKSYRVIYELIEDVEKAIRGMLKKRFREVVLGRAEIRQIFHASKKGNIAGCMVVSGEVSRTNSIRLVRDSVVVFEGRLASLRRVKEDVSKVASGYECGVLVENFSDIKEGDVIECFSMEEVPVEMSAVGSAK